MLNQEATSRAVHSSDAQQQGIDFATILSAAAHDMKNSLQLQLQQMQTLANQLEGSEQALTLADMYYETLRLNVSLTQLLNLYRQEATIITLNPERCLIEELIKDIVADTEFYARHHQVSVHTEVDDGLEGFIDQQVVAVLLQDVVANAIRYASSQVVITAKARQRGVTIQVADDGEGYPEHVITRYAPAQPQPGPTNLASGRTGLGLYFAQRIAQSHQRQQQLGEITLTNDNGGIFTLYLP
ncbi:MAG: HAMP domain-containing histidine kinase [Firmicutes bacterium]|nr:HAMP domain-containing histidine kinase [Bacillota bacterium]